MIRNPTMTSWMALAVASALCGCRGSGAEPANEGARARPGPTPDGSATPAETPEPSARADAVGDPPGDADPDGGTAGDVPTPEEIDAMLADPALHQGLAPTDQALRPPPPRETTPEPPKTNPARRKFGAAVLGALASRDREALLAMTPLESGPLRAVCPDVKIERRALEARIDHCIDHFEWNDIVDARVNGGEPTGEAVPGCADDVRALRRIRVQIETRDGRHDAELRDAIGREDQILGFLGTVTCLER